MNCKYVLTKESYRNLFNQGLCDKEIAKKLGMSWGHISKFRRHVMNLPLLRVITRDAIQLSKYQEEVLIGTLLGDSTIRPVYRQMKNNSLSFAHSIKHKKYFMLKYNILNNIMSSCKEYLRNTNYGGKSIFMAIGKSLKCLNKYRNIFYLNGKKIIPIQYIKENFTKVSLAFLFMDDGCRNTETINLNLQSFELDNLKDFVVFLKDKFNLDFNIKKDKTLYLRYHSREIFYNLIKDYISNDMKYKLKGVMLGLNINN